MNSAAPGTTMPAAAPGPSPRVSFDEPPRGPRSPPDPAPAVPSSGGRELGAFVVNFVVEQTGYPADVVTLDADLEADLGIDSIKKAQLFGELQEHLDVRPDDSLSLDDFPTLRHILDFLTTAAGQA